jgi:hypothetical protein
MLLAEGFLERYGLPPLKLGCRLIVFVNIMGNAAVLLQLTVI